MEKVKKLVPYLLVLLSIPLLQACFPVVATGIVGTGYVVADRRTSAAQLEDQEIEVRANNAIDEKYNDQVHIVPVSFNRHLLLVGEVPDQSTLNDIVAIGKRTTNVENVINELTIGPNLSFSRRAGDTYVTSKVKSRFYADSEGAFSPVHISTTTENHVVYLMGMVTHSEAEAATRIASTTSGVARVVKVFEYIAHVPSSEKINNAQDGKKTSTTPATDIQPAAPSEDVLPANTKPLAP